jgi:phage-related tail fiber protein
MAYELQLTSAGAAKYSAFTSGGAALQITHIAIGDQGGTETTLVSGQAGLVNEVYRDHVSRVYNDPSNASRKIAEIIIPPNVGGFWVREAAIIDIDNEVIAVANLPPAFKADPVTGSSRLLTIRLGIAVVDRAGITEVVFDPTGVLAHRDYIDDAIDSVRADLAADLAALPAAWPDSSKLGGHLPAYFATQSDVTAVNGTVSALSSTVAAIASVPTGIEFGYWGTAAPAGYVLASGRTIGSATSGASERAHADTAALFALLWASGTDVTLPILTSGGAASARGASASADFAANKRISLPDLRGRVGVGMDNMGGSTASRLTTAGASIDGTVLGAAGGAETHTLSSAQMPSHTHTASTTAAGAHTHTGVTDTEPAHTHNNTAYGTGSGAVIGNGATGVQNTARASTSAGSHNHALTIDAAVDHSHAVTVNANGSGNAHNNTQPSIVRNVIIKL